MKTKGLILLVILNGCIFNFILAQKNYAVLISGDRPDYEWFDENDCDVPPNSLTDDWQIWKGSWNDTYLMWEMLVYEKGYDNDNVFVLWADGQDWSVTQLHNIAERYDAHQRHEEDFPGENDQFTDYSATLSNVQSLFQNLANGTGGLPQITDDDFLFIWIYGRNGGEYCLENRTFELFNGNEIWDYELKALIDLIPAHKKVIWADTWFSGCLENEFNYDDADELGTFVLAAGNYDGEAQLLANDFCDYYNESVQENEIIDEIYYHGELDFFAFLLQ